MRSNMILTLAAAGLALGGCGHKSETSSNVITVNTSDGMVTASDGSTTSTVSAGQVFANTAAASDAFEIATSRLAATNGKSSAVKSFASKMIEAHTGSTAKLKTTAAGLTPAITPDPTLSPDQQQKVDSLKALNGVDFDKAYMSAQIDAHQQTLAALKAYASSGDVPQLKSFATSLVPTVTAHLNMAKGLKP